MYRSTLTQSDAQDLLEYIGCQKIGYWKGSKISCCCPVHSESRPSFGLDIDFVPDDNPNLHIAAVNCFACGFHGSVAKLLVETIPEECPTIKAANEWIKDRYGVKFDYLTDEEGNVSVTRYEDKYDVEPERRQVVPITKLAPFKSGKETYQYFFDRGFSLRDMEKFNIGRDIVNETITIPVYWEDNELAGVIGRYIDPSRRHNERYKIYSGFKRARILFPLNHFKTEDGTIILCESQFDCMLLHKWGFSNALCVMGATVSKTQARIVEKLGRVVISLHDNDDAGWGMYENIKRVFRKTDVRVLCPTYYPPKGKDPGEWGKIKTKRVINSAQTRRKIARYE